MTTTPRFRLRWYQFTIRSLFMLMLVVAIAGSWLAAKRGQTERQREAVNKITTLGGHVYYDFQFDASGQLDYDRDWETTPGPVWLKRLLGDHFFTQVTYVSLGRTRLTDVQLQDILEDLPCTNTLLIPRTGVTDARLRSLERRTQLKDLDLTYTHVGDASVPYLKRLTRLEAISLKGTGVTDAGLMELSGLAQLKDLDLSGTKVTDAGLKHLSGLSQLRILAFQRTEVTDAGLEHLNGLKQLRVLLLSDTKVTDEGVKRLQLVLPDCRIRRNWSWRRDESPSDRIRYPNRY